MAHFPKGVGGLGLIFAGHVLLASQSPYLIIVYSGANIIIIQTPSQSLLGKYVIFVIPCNSVTFYFYEFTHGDYFTFHFHLQYKHTGMFANCNHPGLILYNQHVFQIQEHNLQNIFSPFAGCQYFIQNIKKQHIHYWTGSRIQHYRR